MVTLVKLEIFLESSFEGGAHTVVDGEVEGGVHHLHTAASYNVFIHPPHIIPGAAGLLTKHTNTISAGTPCFFSGILALSEWSGLQKCLSSL